MAGSGYLRLALLGALVGSLVTATCSCEGPAGPAPARPSVAWLFPYRQGDKTGFVNLRAEVVVQPRFDLVRWSVKEPPFPVRCGDRWGFADGTTGRLIVPPRYLDVGEFGCGLAPVRDDRGWGFIDTEGRYVIQPTFALAWTFTDGLAPVYARDGKGGYINRKGQFAIAPKFDQVWWFSEGLALVQEGERWLYINKRGRVAIDLSSAGLSAASDRLTSRFREGLACVSQDHKHGYIDKRGCIIIKPAYRDAGQFAEGLAPVASEGKWGYIDRQGRMAIPAKFENAMQFSQGLARVQIQGKTGYIDRRGRIVIKPAYDWGWYFDERGIAPVALGDYWGCVDKAGNRVIWYSRRSKEVPLRVEPLLGPVEELEQ